MNFIRAAKASLLGLALAFAAANAQAINRIEIDNYGSIGADPYGLPWGVVHTDVVTDATGTFWATPPFWATDDSAVIDYLVPDFSRWITMSFSTGSLGVPLAVGVYEGAKGPASNEPGRPVFTFFDNGAGFVDHDGRFEVFDIQRNAQHHVTSFAVSFEVFMGPAPTGHPLMGGRVWFNSDVAIPAIPEPSTWALSALGLAALAWRARASRTRADRRRK